MKPHELCLIMPVFNEAAGLPLAVPRILRAAQQAAPQARIWLIAVDDGSDDDSAACLQRLAGEHPALRVLRFTRNFGKEAALQAGLQYGLAHTAAGVFITLDADLQHPPELLADMLERWRGGALVVEAVKRDRGDESRPRRALARGFYRLFWRLSGIAIDGASDFKLLDRQVAGDLQRLPERVRFYRGMVPWLGYPSEQIAFDVPPRVAGRSAWSRWRLLRYAWRNITAFSSLPLQLVTVAGALGLTVGLLLAAKALYDKLAGQALSGFSTVILLQVIFGSLVLLSLGVIGSYLARIYEEIKRRPPYVLLPPPAGESTDGEAP
jgi:dolichol-phosphate mannosyltransferase